MKTLAIFATALVLATSCGRHAEKVSATETQGSEAITDESETDNLDRARKDILDSVNMANIRQRTIDSMNRVAEHKTAVTPTRKHTTVKPSTAPVATQPAASGNAPVVTSPAPSSPAPETVAAAPEKKKGLNNAVKGALIGLGAGAAGGAVIDKEHRGRGAIIGGVIGATGGAITGGVIDKNKKKKAQQDSIRQDSIRRAQ